jgi:hypothetical protein
MSGGLPSGQTIEYVEGVSHNDANMFGSDAGLNKVKFLALWTPIPQFLTMI